MIKKNIDGLISSVKTLEMGQGFLIVFVRNRYIIKLFESAHSTSKIHTSIMKTPGWRIAWELEWKHCDSLFYLYHSCLTFSEIRVESPDTLLLSTQQLQAPTLLLRSFNIFWNVSNIPLHPPLRLLPPCKAQYHLLHSIRNYLQVWRIHATAV